jgi:hypothetical protein
MTHYDEVIATLNAALVTFSAVAMTAVLALQLEHGLLPPML